MSHNWVIDYSLSLVNRTGAFYLSKDLKGAFFDEWIAVRRWRSHSNRNYSKYERKIRAKLMLGELNRPTLGARAGKWPRLKGCRYLHMDPLYCLNDDLSDEDRVLCHDIGPISHPELYSAPTQENYGRAYQRIRASKPHMTFVSEATRAAFIGRFGEDFPSMDVIPLYLRDALLERKKVFSVPEKPECLSGIQKKFFLSVGEVGRRKGQLQSIKGFSESNLHQEGVDYIICGPRGLGYEAVCREAESTQGVHLLPYVNDDVLAWLYANAQAFVLLSHLEGFGIPVIEASFSGLLPIIGSDPAMIEVTGGHAITCNPYSVDDVAATLRSVVQLDISEKTARTECVLKHARNYTFERFIQSWGGVLGFIEESHV